MSIIRKPGLRLAVYRPMDRRASLLFLTKREKRILEQSRD